MIVVVDGLESKQYDIVSNLRFTKDGQNIRFKAKKNNKWVLVVNGRESGGYDEIYTIGFGEQRDYKGKGRRNAGVQADKCIKVWFKARIENKMVLVIDWKESNKYDYVSSPRCLQDSNAVWFWARNGTKRKLVVNWKESKEYDYVGIPNFKLVNKEWLLWFTATWSNKQILIVDWNESKGYDRVDAPIFSSDWIEVMYTAYNKDEKIFVCKDKEYSLSGWINYTPNSEKI